MAAPLYEIMTGAIMPENPSEYPNRMGSLNKKLESLNAPGRVHELYSSLRGSYSKLPTARPDFRLAHHNWDYLKQYVDACHANGLIFNYTMNSNMLGDLTEITKKYDEIVSGLKKLEEIGVDRVTVSHPILLDMVCKHTNLEIECSTIMNINSLQAPRQLKSMYPNIRKICMGIDKNRNIDFVRNMQEVCESENIILEIMASEFCGIGSMSCTQLHRNHCYNMHSFNMTENEARNGKSVIDGKEVEQPSEVKGYPWSGGKAGCIFNRAGDPTAWLMTKTIWPNELKSYATVTGIHNIKITTRTAPIDFAEYLTTCYATGKYDGPLAGLWLALPASLLSSRENFDKIQNVSVNAIPYMCNDLSSLHKTSMHVWVNDEWVHLDGEFRFIDIFLMFQNVDWSDIVWVDKPDQELKPYENNWIHKWHKICSKA